MELEALSSLLSGVYDLHGWGRREGGGSEAEVLNLQLLLVCMDSDKMQQTELSRNYQMISSQRETAKFRLKPPGQSMEFYRLIV